MQTAAYTPIDEEFETNNPFFPYFFENDKYAPRPVLTEDCYYKDIPRRRLFYRHEVF